jgi:UDP-N-acetyl-D-glucosamine/UDP-N-acetyl-D-galactosamine dehydrogenase
MVMTLAYSENQERAENQERVAVIGLGYVGLPLAVALARQLPGTVGFDVAERRVCALRQGRDEAGQVSSRDLESVALTITSDIADLNGTTMFVVAVPTPIDGNRQPDLSCLEQACLTVAKALRPGAVVVFESTVYPGVTEEICGPLLARASGLRQGLDFSLGYSPERINPGDQEHCLENVVKIVAAADDDTLDRLVRVYGLVVSAGLHIAPSIRVAEAAKVIENTQRDLNIALMNELALIFDRLGICTHDVLQAAGSKWNFLPFTPGLVGGHCIGVDPYYLTAKAEAVGHHPEVILAGRRINDNMGVWLAQRLVKLLIAADVPAKQARVGVLGLTFKEDVADLRNSRVPDIIAELAQFGIKSRVHDPLASPEEARALYGLHLQPLEALQDLDALVLAVPHQAYLNLPPEQLFGMVRPAGIIMDVKSNLRHATVPGGRTYWSL